jgi:cell division protein FtsB
MEEPRRLIVWVSVGVMALLLFGNDGFRNLAGEGLERRHLEKKLLKLRADNERLTRELSMIQQDPSYTEYLIRKSLGYAKKDEVEYRLIKKP